MPKLISIKALSNLLGVSKQSIHGKITRGSIPKECLVELEVGSRKNIRVDIELLMKRKPRIKRILEKNDTESNGGSEKRRRKNLITIGDFSRTLGLSVSSVYRHIDEGLYPFVELPSSGLRRKIRILRDKTILKFPQLERALDTI